jgi:cell division protein FtsL
MKTIRFVSSALSTALLLCIALTGSGLAAEPTHVVSGLEIQTQIDRQLDSQASDRQAIRDLLARPEVQRIAGSAGLSLERANAAVGTLSGPELQRLAEQSRQANSQIVGGDTVVMTWTMVIIIVVALVVLIAVL